MRVVHAGMQHAPGLAPGCMLHFPLPAAIAQHKLCPATPCPSSLFSNRFRPPSRNAPAAHAAQVAPVIERVPSKEAAEGLPSPAAGAAATGLPGLQQPLLAEEAPTPVTQRAGLVRALAIVRCVQTAAGMLPRSACCSAVLADRATSTTCLLDCLHTQQPVQASLLSRAPSCRYIEAITELGVAPPPGVGLYGFAALPLNYVSQHLAPSQGERHLPSRLLPKTTCGHSAAGQRLAVAWEVHCRTSGCSLQRDFPRPVLWYVPSQSPRLLPPPPATAHLPARQSRGQSRPSLLPSWVAQRLQRRPPPLLLCLPRRTVRHRLPTSLTGSSMRRTGTALCMALPMRCKT